MTGDDDAWIERRRFNEIRREMDAARYEVPEETLESFVGWIAENNSATASEMSDELRKFRQWRRTQV